MRRLVLDQVEGPNKVRKPSVDYRNVAAQIGPEAQLREIGFEIEVEFARGGRHFVNE